MTDQEINEAVAIKLGWEKIVGPEPMRRVTWIRKNQFGEGKAQFPDYATDIKAAWEIVEKHDVRIDNVQGDWEVSFWTKKVPVKRLADGSANTAPLAICKAFLKLPETK